MTGARPAGMTAVVGLAVVAATSAGCPPPDPCEKKTNVLDNNAWALVSPADDPFAQDPTKLIEPDADGQYPPDDPGGDTPHNDRVCQTADVYSEVLDGDTSLTVNTNICGWATVEETLNTAFAAGDAMFVRLFYFQQIAPGIADAHIVLTADGETVYSDTLPLPQPSTLIAQDFKAPVSAKKGAKLMFHIDNHGINTWNFLELSLTTPITCPPS